MRFISSLDQHPEMRKLRFPERLWPPSNDPKEAVEGWIFLEFTAAAGLRADNALIKCQPPMPDLECVIQGARRFFELGEILESNLAEGLAYSGKQSHLKMEAIRQGEAAGANSTQTAGFRRFPANASLERILRQKLAKRYQTGGIPTDLLLFYDQQTPWGPFDYLLQWQDELAELISRSVFQRVWIFNLPCATLIGYLEAPSHRILRAIFDWQFHFDGSAPFEALVPGGGQTSDETSWFTPVLTQARSPKP
jgi:hypothetical protein